MTALREVIAGLEPIEGGWRAHVPEGWLQGRTAYGGVSARRARRGPPAPAAPPAPPHSARVGAVAPAPPRRRGRFLACLDLFWPFGLLLATGLSWLFLDVLEGEWRWLYVAAAFPALFAWVAPPGARNVPLLIGSLTLGITVVAATGTS